MVISLATMSLAACGARNEVAPVGAALQLFDHGLDPAKTRGGLYVTAQYYGTILGYRSSNRRNKPPICSIQLPTDGDVAVDMHGNLIVPTYGPTSQSFIDVYKGPTMCGPKVASILDPYGVPVDAASIDALSGTIVVANQYQGTSYDPGDVALCSVKSGCQSVLYGSGSNYNYFVAVALAKSGDCWSSNVDVSYAASLLYYKGCTGIGQYATGFQNHDAGGLDIDGSGNLVSISRSDATLYVYKGCNPNCKLLGGPFQLLGRPVYGRLNHTSTRFAVGDRMGVVDIYRYKPTSLKHQFSFSNGLPSGVSGATYNPRSNE